MKMMKVTYKRYNELEMESEYLTIEVEAENFGDAKTKADIELNKHLNQKEMVWKAYECEVVEDD